MVSAAPRRHDDETGVGTLGADLDPRDALHTEANSAACSMPHHDEYDFQPIVCVRWRRPVRRFGPATAAKRPSGAEIRPNCAA
ncbi:hypothetical protein AJ88_37405 [Mesorhizobium amorphae CCBAU 01583]|nr:hypothetical protein AJ88_37405 [Mesorhizobium amorphae CCBAU 01583]